MSLRSKSEKSSSEKIGNTDNYKATFLQQNPMTCMNQFGVVIFYIVFFFLFERAWKDFYIRPVFLLKD